VTGSGGGPPVRRDVAGTPSYDRTLRLVMWLDAFLSLALVGVSLVLLPVVAALDVPHDLFLAVGLAAIASGVLLGALGAVTGVALLLRLNAGEYLLPVGLRLPLPRPMRPDIG
jgi:hypothetical protein